MGVKTQNTSKKIILTTDQDLIADGVQSIDNKFLEWFVKNPSCENIELDVDLSKHNGQFQTKYGWKIIIPQEEPKQKKWDKLNKELDDALEEEFGLEEPKQETLEEAIKREYEARKFNSDFPFDPQSFKLGAKYQANQNQEDINKLISIIEWYDNESDVRPDAETFMWFEQFKKK
jgi:hypothetical protein